MHDLWLLPKPTYIVSQFTRCLCFLIFHIQNWTTKIKNPGSLFSALFSRKLPSQAHVSSGESRQILLAQDSGRVLSYCWPRAVQILLSCFGLVPLGVSHMLEWACSVYEYCSRAGFLLMNLSCSRNGAGISPRVFSAFC